MTSIRKRLFIPRKTQQPVQQPTYNTDMLKIEGFINTTLTFTVTAGVNRIIAGTGVTVSPATGKGTVTVSATGGGGGTTFVLDWAEYTVNGSTNNAPGTFNPVMHKVTGKTKYTWGTPPFNKGFTRLNGTTGYTPLTAAIHNTATTGAYWLMTNATAGRIIVSVGYVASWSLVEQTPLTNCYVFIGNFATAAEPVVIAGKATSFWKTSVPHGGRRRAFAAGNVGGSQNFSLASGGTFRLVSPIVYSVNTSSTPTFNIKNTTSTVNAFQMYLKASLSILVLKS